MRFLPLLVLVVALAAACSSKKPAATPTSPAAAVTHVPTATTTTSVAALSHIPSATATSPAAAVTPVPNTAPVTEDNTIWDFATAWVQGNIIPILRPAAPPDGFDIVQPLVIDIPGKEDHDTFGVVYGKRGGGSGRALTIQGFDGLTAANLPDPGPGTSQTIVNVRGVPAVLQVTPASTTPPYTGGVLVLWIEGEAINGVVPPHISRDHPQYSIHAIGLSPDEVVAIANSLQPYP